MLNYEKLIVGEMRTNCYLVWDEDKNAVVIDPGDEAEFISDEIEKRQLKLKNILLTHKHFDHVGAVKYLQLIYNVSILNPLPPPLRGLSPLTKGESAIFDFQVIKTPGHTTDSVCFYSPTLEVVFTGDTLFKDLPTRNENLESIKKLLKLPKETIVLPGHDEETTIAAEARRY
jgi:glyoxylase-like metal-dependent hydrolase (beta-lactamase superfamily II)